VSNTREMISVEPERIEADLSWRNGRHIFVDKKSQRLLVSLIATLNEKLLLNKKILANLEQVPISKWAQHVHFQRHWALHLAYLLPPTLLLTISL